jgi:hypothetical protein
MKQSPASVVTSPLHLANLNTFNPKTSLHFSDTYVFRGTAPSQKPFGELFLVLQIDHATKSSPQVGDAIATILQHEYYRGNPSDAPKNFEDALHKTNEILSDLAARGEIHWIGKLHSVAAVFQKDAIHVSATGRAKAYLVRNSEIAEVSQGLYDASKAASPLKTFEHVASGELKDGDALLFVTPGISDYLSPQQLREIVRSNSPEQAAQEIQHRVGRDPAKANSAIVLRFDKKSIRTVTTPSTARQPSAKSLANVQGGSPRPSTGLLKSNEALATSAAHVAPKNSNASTGKLVGAKKFKLPNLARFFKRSRDKTKTETDQHDAKSRFADKPAARDTKKGRVRVAFAQAFKRIPMRAKLFSGLAIVLVVVFVISLFVFRGSRASQAERASIEAKITQAQQLEEQAAAAIIFKDRTQALNLLKQAEALLNEVPGGKTYEEKVTVLRASIAQDYEKLSGSVKIDSPAVLADLSIAGEAVGLTLVEGQLVTWTDGGEVGLVSIDNGEQASAGSLSRGQGDPLLGTTTEEGMVLLTDSNSFVALEDGKLKDLDVSGSFEPKQPAAIETYGNRLYLLDPASNKLTRHQRTIAGYTQGETWVVDDTSVSEGVDVAIDGNVWILQKTGSLTKMLQGTREEFTLGGMLDPLSAPTRLITSEDMKYLYILEPSKKRLAQFDKESGEFVRQYTSDAFDSLRDMVIVEKGKKAYLLNGQKVLTVDLQL